MVEVRTLAFKLNHQGFVDCTLQSQATDMSKVANCYRVEQDVDDVCIIPDALCREVVALQVTYGEVVFCTIVGGGISANFQTVDAVVVESVPTE